MDGRKVPTSVENLTMEQRIRRIEYLVYRLCADQYGVTYARQNWGDATEVATEIPTWKP